MLIAAMRSFSASSNASAAARRAFVEASQMSVIELVLNYI